MANELRRVGLVFKKDGAVDFKKSLQEINIELNKNYNQFKLTQSQWDKSTKSTEKLRAEQEYLKNAYEIQSDKVKTLKMQLSDLENAENKNVTAIKKKQNELSAAEIKLESYGKKIKEIDAQLTNTGKKIEEWGKKIEKTGGKVEKAGKKLSAFSGAVASALIYSTKSAIDFEDAFTGVEKTVDGTEEQMEELKKGIRDLAKQIPSTTTEISAVAEAAGQLGIKTEDILSFTKVMIDLGNSTNLSAEEAASSLAKFANITNMSAKDYDKLGSTIVALGNNFATTEADIVSMATKLASTGELTGLTEPQILALATAMSSVGIEAEAGGSAMSKLLKKIQVATETGGKDLENFAKVAGMSIDEFKVAFQEDAVSALSSFIGGLNDTERNGKSAIAILDDMGITEVRLSNTVLALANSNELMTKAINLGNEAWEDNTALTNEANKRYSNLKSKLQTAMNKLKDIAITIGNKLMPVVEKIVDKIGEWVKAFDKLSDEQVKTIVKIGLIIAAVGPLLLILGKVITVIGGIVTAIGTFTQAIALMKGTIETASASATGLAKVFTGLTSPVGLACMGITAAIAAISISINNAKAEAEEAKKKMQESLSNMADGVNRFSEEINSAKSHLNDFNETLFVSSEEQQQLQTQMEEVQNGITLICRTASEERRSFTQEEIDKLDNYFEQLRTLNDRELEIQKQISEAIAQQAITNAETFQGSLEEYKVQSSEWIKTATEQKKKTVDLIEQQTIQEVALLNMRYSTEEDRQSEAYQEEYGRIIAQKEDKIAQANDEVARIIEIYTQGYTERAKEDEEWYKKTKDYNDKYEAESKRHEQTLVDLEELKAAGFRDAENAIGKEQYNHLKNIAQMWDEYTKDLSDAEEKELGNWLARVAQTEMYGGEIDQETEEIVDNILATYDLMNDETKETMKNAMQGMIVEMQNKEPELYAKASSIANGIINRLNKAFDIHSPSKKTRKIFKNVMKRNGKGN